MDTDERTKPRRPRRKQFFEGFNSFVNLGGVLAVAVGVWVAKVTLDSIDENLEVARAALETQQANHRLEQRAWLNYDRLTLQSAPTKTADFRDTKVSDPHDNIRLKLSIVNNGRTPAFNVTITMCEAGLTASNYTTAEPSWPPPTPPAAADVITPGSPMRDFFTPLIVTWPQQVKDYMNGEMRLFLWTRLQYCDVYNHRHWLTTAFAKEADDDPAKNVTILQQQLGPADGEPNHPYCSTAALQARRQRPSYDTQPCQTSESDSSKSPSQ